MATSMLTLFSLLSLAFGSEIVVVGDSWGTEGAKAFREMFSKRGIQVTIDNIAVGGSTAADWAKTPNRLRDAVKADTKHVWLTICGNDAKDNMVGCGARCVPKVVEGCLRDTAKFLEPMWHDHPDVNVVQFGYDILIFNHWAECALIGEAILPDCGLNTTCRNSQFRRLQYEYVDVLTKSYPNHHAVDIAGAMQKAGGDNHADIGAPDLTKYSPYKFMQSNCIHANDIGFGHVFDALYDVYFQHFYPGGNSTAAQGR